MSMIYIVMGMTGEYSDRKEWGVRAYRDEKVAQEHVIKASERAREIFNIYKEKGLLWQYILDDERRTEINAYDPNFEIDYNGTSYYINTVELYEGR